MFRLGPTQTGLYSVDTEGSQKLQIRTSQEEGLFNPCSENKDDDQLCSCTAQLICVFVFAYAIY